MKDIVITSLETITAFDIVTGNYKFTIDELQNATIEQSEDVTELTGKGGRRLANLKRNKSVTISGSNGLVSGGLLEMQTGGTFENKATEVMWTDYLSVLNGEATTAWKAVGTAGAEIDGLFLRNSTDGTLGAELVQGDTASNGVFTYDPATKTLGFSGLEDDTEIVVYYKRKIVADVLENDSDVFAGKCALYVDAFGEDKCANVYRVQIYIPKADFNGNFTFEMGDNQTVHSFEAEALAGACGAAGLLWTYTVFGDNAEDSDAGLLSSIEITTAPTTTSYTVGDTFDPTGMVVTANYSNGDSAALNAGSYTYTPNGSLAASNTSILIKYTEGSITKTTTQAITVSA